MAFGKTGIDWRSTVAAVWRSNRHFLKPITQVELITPDSLLGIDEQKALLYKNTENFLRGKPSSHALLWGARGVGKTSLIKTLLTRYHSYGLRIIEIPKTDLHLLPDITDDLREQHHHFIIYCDDLTFEEGQREYSLLKSTMEGALETPPTNVLIYATSNRRSLLPAKLAANFNRDLRTDSAKSDEDDHYVLADRFGLSLSFETMDKEIYLAIIDQLFKGKQVERSALHEEALTFASDRGGYSGRTARHFLTHYQIYM
ncbi:MAG: DUF815 domain-containing protein [Thiothrix sp.]|nr:MAG: DUF815 domain-containing protein [Thiothrix sp.]